MARSERYVGPERRAAPRGATLQRGVRPFFAVLRWIRGHVGGFYAALGLYLLLGLGAALVGILLFAGVAALMAKGLTQRIDEAVLLWLNTRATPELDAVALEVTALGSGVVVWLTLLIASVFLWGTRHRYSAALLWVAVLGAGVLNTALKSVFDRPRPELFEWRVPYAGHSSFPSGHAMTAMVVYATLAYLVVRLEPTRGLRRFTIAVFAVVIVAVGISRVYLGVHYPSDVVGGFVIGFVWATLCALGIEVVRYFRDRRPQVRGEEKDLEQGAGPIAGHG